MDTKSQQMKPQREDTLSALNTAIEAMNLAKELTPAMDIFSTVSGTLTMLRVSSFLFVLSVDCKLK